MASGSPQKATRISRRGAAPPSTPGLWDELLDTIIRVAASVLFGRYRPLVNGNSVHRRARMAPVLHISERLVGAERQIGGSMTAFLVTYAGGSAAG